MRCRFSQAEFAEMAKRPRHLLTRSVCASSQLYMRGPDDTPGTVERIPGQFMSHARLDAA